MNIIHKVFQIFLIILIITVFFYTYYKSEIIFNGEQRENYFVFYLFIFFLVVIFILYRISNIKIRDYILIIFISSLVSVYLFEYYMVSKFYTANLSQKDLIEIKSKLSSNDNFEKRSLAEFYSDKKKENPNIVVRMYPGDNLSNNELIPLSGISNSMTIHCNESGYFSVYMSDRYGFNNPDEIWDKKDIEYFLVGDSFLHGECVNRPNDLGSLLRSLSKKDVLNLGYGGNGPLLQYATIKEYLRSDIKKVIWIYYSGNDLRNLDSELKSNILSKYFFDKKFSQNLINNQNKSNDLLKDLMNKAFLEQQRIDKLKKDENILRNIFKFFKLYSSRNFFQTYLNYKNKEENNLDNFKLILKRTKKLLDENNSKLYFVYLPSYDHLKYSLNDKNLKNIENILVDLNIDLINIKNEIFDKSNDKLSFFPFKMKGHYTIDGYKEVANKIFELTK